MDYRKEYERWLSEPTVTAEEKEELLAIANDEKEIAFRFSHLLSFGTAGLRGTMKAGLNAMNVHTVAYATQGLANLILGEQRAKNGVVIAYDSRNNSKLFAETAAEVLAANGICVYLFDSLRPTPELSFAVRELGCVAGINITASHNPKQYNGYKAYWEDGAQLPPEHADTVVAEISKLDIFRDVRKMPLEKAIAKRLVTMIGKEIDEKYLSAVLAQVINPQAVKAVADDLKIVYTPLHGAGYRMVPEVMRRIGVKHLYPVEAQMVPDGNFPTLVKPNPEYPAAFTLGIEVANRVGCDLIIATDPDADRVGVMTRTKSGAFRTITGNQMGALLADYIITAYKKTGTMPPEPYMVKTIVTSEMTAKICAENNIRLYNVLTGFKFIGEVIKKQERAGHGTFLFGFEESYGYLKGTYARDKDSVVTAMLITEMTAYYHAAGMTLSDALDDLFRRYGFYYEVTGEVYMEGYDGVARISALMDELRQNPPKEFSGSRVAVVGDYLKQTITDGKTSKPTGLPRSNVISFRLENGDMIVARPSGTEPKVKFYYLLEGENEAQTKEKFAAYEAFFNRLAGV